MAATMMKAFALTIGVLLHTAAYGQSVDDVLVPPTPAEAADIATWIPSSCCWSNRCCRKVGDSAFVPLANNQYRIVASGQVVTRNGWSRDGNNWRCTCDQDDSGKWVVHLKANTRCLFPAAPAGS